MTSPGVGRSVDPEWRKLYEAAILELDPAMLPGRVQDAKKAIQTRILELQYSGQHDECLRLMDALQTLDDLLRMHKATEPREGQH
jgi:hypothetical protein